MQKELEQLEALYELKLAQEREKSWKRELEACEKAAAARIAEIEAAAKKGSEVLEVANSIVSAMKADARKADKKLSEADVETAAVMVDAAHKASKNEAEMCEAKMEAQRALDLEAARKASEMEASKALELEAARKASEMEAQRALELEAARKASEMEAQRALELEAARKASEMEAQKALELEAARKASEMEAERSKQGEAARKAFVSRKAGKEMELKATPETKRAKLAKAGAPDAAHSAAAKLAALDLERQRLIAWLEEQQQAGVTAPLAKSAKSCTVLSLKIPEVAVEVFSDYCCKLDSARCSQGWMSWKLNPWIHLASVLFLPCLVRS